MKKKAIYSKDHKAVIKKLIRARNVAGLRQEDVAKLLGSTQPHISDLEKGQRRVDLMLLKRLSQIYKSPFVILVSSKFKLYTLQDIESLIKKKKLKPLHPIASNFGALLKNTY